MRSFAIVAPLALIGATAVAASTLTPPIPLAIDLPNILSAIAVINSVSENGLLDPDLATNVINSLHVAAGVNVGQVGTGMVKRRVDERGVGLDLGQIIKKATAAITPIVNEINKIIAETAQKDLPAVGGILASKLKAIATILAGLQKAVGGLSTVAPVKRAALDTGALANDVTLLLQAVAGVVMTVEKLVSDVPVLGPVLTPLLTALNPLLASVLTTVDGLAKGVLGLVAGLLGGVGGLGGLGGILSGVLGLLNL